MNLRSLERKSLFYTLAIIPGLLTLPGVSILVGGLFLMAMGVEECQSVFIIFTSRYSPFHWTCYAFSWCMAKAQGYEILTREMFYDAERIP